MNGLNNLITIRKISSIYTSFIKERIAKLFITNPEMSHQERFYLAADAWIVSDKRKILQAINDSIPGISIPFTIEFQ